MDSPEELHLEPDEFLKEIANKCGFNAREQAVFVIRFDPKNSGRQHQEIMGTLWKEDYANMKLRIATTRRRQKFTDTLNRVSNKLYKAFKHEGCPIKNHTSRGNPPKGQRSYWKEVYDWLYQTKFPNWRRMRATDWSVICSQMFNKQRQATSNKLVHEYEDAKFDKYQQIHVPLALVRRTKPDKRSGEYPAEAGSRVYEPQYEEKQRFEHSAFLHHLELEESETEERRIAVIGEAGAGKTTLLQEIADRVIGKTEPARQQETKDVAIWVSLAALKGRSLEEYLLQTWLKEALKVARTTLEQELALVELFNSGQVWLLLDGVDEMASADPQATLVSHLTSWVASARVVLTCRLNLWQGNVNLLTDFKTYRLLDFDPQQVHLFIDKWFSKSDSTKGERLVRLVRSLIHKLR